MKILILILTSILIPTFCLARLGFGEAGNNIDEKSDLIAVATVLSITNSIAKLEGHGDPDLYQGKIAKLRIGKPFKGTISNTEIEMHYFTYAEGKSSPNGATFINFKDPDKYDFLVYLKLNESGQYIPASGFYDSIFSVRLIEREWFRIPSNKLKKPNHH